MFSYQLILQIVVGKNLKSLSVKFSKKKLQQDQEKITETNKSQIKPNQIKPKVKANKPVKTMKKQNLCQKRKEMLTKMKNELANKIDH